MDRRTARNAVVAIVGFVAVGIAAATIRIPTERNDGSGGGGGTPEQAAVTPSGAESLSNVPHGWLLHLVVIVILVFFVVYVLSDLRRAVMATVASAVLGIIVFLLFTMDVGVSLSGNTTLEVGNASPGSWDGSGSAGDGQESTETMPPVWWLWAPLLGFLLLASAFVLSRDRSESRTDSTGDDEDRAEPGAIGAAAGDAADRIRASGESVDNEVYRAWVEMTSLLDAPHPQSGTPGEFAEAAIDAGLRRSDVRELTELFEEVRYGGRDPGNREERAVETLRRIESTYADEVSTGDDDSNGWWGTGER